MGETFLRESLSYSTDVLPKDAPTIQFVETRRAFYAGAQALLALMARVIAPGLEDPTAADMAAMDSIKA